MYYAYALSPDKKPWQKKNNFTANSNAAATLITPLAEPSTTYFPKLKLYNKL
jgi:hypothetical protein